jgi:hypothetical protein
MIELLYNNYFFLLYFAALLLSLLRYRQYYDTILKYLPVLIAYTVLSEVLGFAVRNFDEIQIVYKEEYYYYNTLIFNIFDIIFYLYFLSIYHKVLVSNKRKKFVKLGILLFIFVSVINLFLQNFYVDPQNYAIIVGSFFTVVSAFMYLVQLQKDNAIQKTGNLLFWISIGITFFHLFYPITMYILSFEYELYTYLKLARFHYLSIAIFYTCFIIGFIKVKRRKPYEISD